MTTSYKLVDFLARASARNDGAVLSALRRGWTQPLAIYPIVAPFLPVPPSKRAEDASILVALLFGSHPKPGSVAFAAGMRVASDRRGSKSIEARMAALIATPFDDLPRQLRRAVALVAGEGVALDWHRLMDDLLRWDAEGEPVQRAWARAYWGAHETRTTTDTNETTKEPTL
jgi:CRISPR type I-E-associated protein CasB/Cse2